MKKTTILILIIIIWTNTYSQIFPEPTGSSNTYSTEKKIIDKCESYAVNTAFSDKLNTEARRYKFNLAIWDECYQINGNRPHLTYCPTEVSCHDCPSCESGWKKIGRITYVRDNNLNKHKLHVGWRPDAMHYQQLKLSAYFHEGFSDKYVSHYIANVYTNTAPNIDMFMSLETIALIADDKAIVIRKPGMIPSRKRSMLNNVFYYGDPWWETENPCSVHNSMAVEFRNRESDKSGFAERLNSCNYITINLSVFKSNDNHTFYAFKELHGSVANPNIVQTSMSDYNKQQCEIPNGAVISFVAGEKIYLFPGFHAKIGSNFDAKIEHKTRLNDIDDVPIRLNLPPINQPESCNNSIDTISFFKSAFDEKNTIILSEFALYPNPNTGVFNIFTEIDQNFTVEVMSSNGVIVYEKTTNLSRIKIDITSSPKGLYIVIIRCEGKSFIKKILYT
jgi:hypothetical protein